MSKKKNVTKIEVDVEKASKAKKAKKQVAELAKPAKVVVKKPEKVEVEKSAKKPEKVKSENVKPEKAITKKLAKVKVEKAASTSSKKFVDPEVASLFVDSCVANTLVLPADEIVVVAGFNPRETLGSISELSDSIKAVGMIENLVVWQDKTDHNKYKLICGHRRLEAAIRAGVQALPVSVILSVTNLNQALVLAIAENSSDNRSNFTPIEEAKAYQRLIDAGYNITEISLECSVSRKKIDKLLKILTLPDVLKDRFYAGKLTGSAASTFVDLTMDDQKIVLKVADTITTKAQIDEILRQARSPYASDFNKGNSDDESTEGGGKPGKRDTGRKTEGVYRNIRDTRNAALNFYDKYNRAATDDPLLVPYEWAMAALLYVMGEMSVIDPETPEFQEGLELLDSTLSKMQGDKVQGDEEEELEEDEEELEEEEEELEEEDEEEEEWDEEDEEEEEEEEEDD